MQKQKVIVADKHWHTTEYGTTNVQINNTDYGVNCEVRVRGEGPSRTVYNVDDIQVNQQLGTAQLHSMNGHTALIHSVTSIRADYADGFIEGE